MDNKPKEETPNPTVTSVNPTTTDPITPTPKVDSSEELGKAKAERDEWKKKFEQAQPVLESVYTDPEAYKAVERAYQKKMGIKVDDSPKDETKTDKPTATETVSKIELDNRNALISQSVSAFEKSHAIDKLAAEDKKNVNIAIINELKGILDPHDTGKDGAALLNDVPLAKLPAILEKAYYLATKDQRETKIKEDAVRNYQQSETGLIGSIPSGSPDASEEVILSEKEKKTAKRMGLSDEQYLKNKLEIAKRDGKIY